MGHLAKDGFDKVVKPAFSGHLQNLVVVDAAELENLNGFTDAVHHAGSSISHGMHAAGHAIGQGFQHAKEGIQHAGHIAGGIASRGA